MIAAQYFWLIPLFPLLAAGLLAFARRKHRLSAAVIALLAMAASLVFSCFAFAETLRHPGERLVRNFKWFDLGETVLELGVVLDPLAAVMLVMVTVVGGLIFVYSIGYMAGEENFGRFFCFLSLFASAMLGLVMANSLLLFFICWELVGLCSYLLIGFWHHKPEAAAAAKKAFITTRIGDLGLFLGMIWLYAQTGTLLFYDQGEGCLEPNALGKLMGSPWGGAFITGNFIALLFFVGAMGKSGQLPLHVWLPDAMEGPTPVSALIHAATMVAAGVFLVARVFPIMELDPRGLAGVSLPLSVITWTGAATAVFAAAVAVAQSDIKRILAYSTISQLGFMMIGIGAGGIAAGMFHLLTHAFFKALLFLGAGSVIHACHGEQDIQFMGGLKRAQPVTFAAYAIGMMALSGVPLLFSGFWSKDEILHAAHAWPVSSWPFFMGLGAAFLTAFYMTRQIGYVFFGKYQPRAAHGGTAAVESQAPHESPLVMIVPLIVLAAGAVLLGFLGTPAWPWLQKYLLGTSPRWEWDAWLHREFLFLALLSTMVVAGGLALGWVWYGPRRSAGDPLQERWPGLFGVLRDKLYFDELYEVGLVRAFRGAARACADLDRSFGQGIVAVLGSLVLGWSWLTRLADEYVVNSGFHQSCLQLIRGARRVAAWQSGDLQTYLRVIGLAFAVLLLLLAWG